MNFYHILFALKQGFNRNLTWYENLFVRFYNNTIAKLVARILRIKGNTVSFNQLVQANSETTSAFGLNFKFTSGVLTISGTSTTTNSSVQVRTTFFNETLIDGHKYYIKGATSNVVIRVQGNATFDTGSGAIFTVSGSSTYADIVVRLALVENTSYNYSLKPQLHDLTLMGIDNLTTTTEVEQWLSSHIGSLPYYAYTQGTLIPFNGTGLQSTNIIFGGLPFAQSLVDNAQGQLNQTAKSIYFTGQYANNQDIFVFNFKENTQYTLILTGSGSVGRSNLRFVYTDGTSQVISNLDTTVTTVATVSQANKTLSKIQGMWNSGTTTLYYEKCGLFEGVKTVDDFEPYTSNTLSLPTLTYFPTGMKSAGSVYDELTPSKATTNISSDKISIISMYTPSANPNFDFAVFAVANAWKNNFLVNGWFRSDLPLVYYNVNYASTANENTILIYDTASKWLAISVVKGTTLEQAQAKFNNHDFIYAVATPTETDISPELDLTYPVWNGGTEQILPVNTSTPTTSGIVADIKYPDGIRYGQTFVYRVIEKATQLGNRALSIMLGKKVETDNPEEPLEILLKGEK